MAAFLPRLCRLRGWLLRILSAEAARFAARHRPERWRGPRSTPLAGSSRLDLRDRPDLDAGVSAPRPASELAWQSGLPAVGYPGSQTHRPHADPVHASRLAARAHHSPGRL